MQRVVIPGAAESCQISFDRGWKMRNNKILPLLIFLKKSIGFTHPGRTKAENAIHHSIIVVQNLVRGSETVKESGIWN